MEDVLVGYILRGVLVGHSRRRGLRIDNVWVEVVQRQRELDDAFRKRRQRDRLSEFWGRAILLWNGLFMGESRSRRLWHNLELRR